MASSNESAERASLLNPSRSRFPLHKWISLPNKNGSRGCNTIVRSFVRETLCRQAIRRPQRGTRVPCEMKLMHFHPTLRFATSHFAVNTNHASHRVLLVVRRESFPRERFENISFRLYPRCLVSAMGWRDTIKRRKRKRKRKKIDGKWKEGRWGCRARSGRIKFWKKISPRCSLHLISLISSWIKSVISLSDCRVVDVDRWCFTVVSRKSDRVWVGSTWVAFFMEYKKFQVIVKCNGFEHIESTLLIIYYNLPDLPHFPSHLPYMFSYLWIGVYKLERHFAWKEFRFGFVRCELAAIAF